MKASTQHTAVNPNSDHEPDKDGVVHAIDITKDLAHGVDSRAIAQGLLDSRDPRIKYIISNGEMARTYPKAGTVPWQWSPYTGTDDHSHHFHLSVVADPALCDSQLSWKFSTGGVPSGLLLHSGKGSWYSQYVGKFTWVDTGDAPGSAALGIPDDAQGVSFFDHDTLGKWFLVRAPNGVISLEQQTDIGPHPNTGRLIDISAAAAERFGYSPNNFPTDEVFSWALTLPPAAVINMTPQQQAVRYRDVRSSAPPAPQPIPTPLPPTKEPPMDLFKFLPLLMRIMQILPQIQDAMKSGTSIFTLLSKFAPDLIGILTGIGGSLFPELPAPSQAQAGGLMMDPVKVRLIQGQINTLGLATPPLVVDGSYGQLTKAAVTAFQIAHNVTPADGWAGDVTTAALQTEINKLNASEKPALVGAAVAGTAAAKPF